MALGLDAGNNIIKKNMKQKFHVWLAIVGDIITPLSSHTIKARGGFTLSLAFHLFSIISLYRSTRLGNWHSNRARRAPARRRRKLCISVTFSRLLTIKPDFFVEHRSERRWSMLAGINHSNTAAIDLVTITYKLPCCFWPRVKSGDIEHSKKKMKQKKTMRPWKTVSLTSLWGITFMRLLECHFFTSNECPLKGKWTWTVALVFTLKC